MVNRRVAAAAAAEEEATIYDLQFTIYGGILKQ
jgi:hypothetical protein